MVDASRKSRFHRRGAGTGGVFPCANCGRRTRNVDQASPDLCPECDEFLAIENGIDDGAYGDPAGLAAAEAYVTTLKRRCASKGGDPKKLGL